MERRLLAVLVGAGKCTKNEFKIDIILFQMGSMRRVRHPSHDQLYTQRYWTRQDPVYRVLHGHYRIHGGHERTP